MDAPGLPSSTVRAETSLAVFLSCNNSYKEHLYPVDGVASKFDNPRQSTALNAFPRFSPGT